MKPWYLLGGAILVAGCTALTNGPVQDSTTAFIQAKESDAQMLKTLSEKQTALLEDCEESKSCDEVHFTRGLLGLFENREAAAIAFRRTVEINPSGPFAISSTRWLDVLSKSPGLSPPSSGADTAMNSLTEGLVRTWLHQKYLACLSAGNGTTMPPSNAQPSLKVLQRKIHDRDKRIAEMTEQLELLKNIEGTKSKKMGHPQKTVQ